MDEDLDQAAGQGRPAQVCQGCRVRHVRCDFDKETCRQCRSIGLECIRQPTFRFRHDPKQIALAAEAASSKTVWKRPRAPLRFFDETPSLVELYNDDDVAIQQPEPGPASTVSTAPVPHVTPSPGRASLGTAAMVPTYLSPLSDQTSPENLIGQSPGQWTAIKPFSEAEAILIRNFIDNMALWTDIADQARMFELELPRRALAEPILRHAICAFSARHLYRNLDGGRAEALDHQDKCLQLLIPAMSGTQSINDSILAAIAVLRQNEEMDDEDNRFHLEGASRILKMVPDFAAAGGLGEAAAWLCLREDIYISLTTQSTIKIGLESFRRAASIVRGDDFSWANKMVLNLAALLNRAFSAFASQEDLAASEFEIEDWDRTKPATYQPIHYRGRNVAERRFFPEIWLLAPHQVLGLQYYHIAQIVLLILRQKMSARPYETLLENRTTERKIRHHLLIVVGLAISNEKAENTWFTASHSLSVWAGCLRKKGDQQAALHFLHDMQQRTGWKTAPLAETLRAQWEEDSDDG